MKNLFTENRVKLNVLKTNFVDYFIAMKLTKLSSESVFEYNLDLNFC